MFLSTNILLVPVDFLPKYLFSTPISAGFTPVPVIVIELLDPGVGLALLKNVTTVLSPRSTIGEKFTLNVTSSSAFNVLGICDHSRPVAPKGAVGAMYPVNIRSAVPLFVTVNCLVSLAFVATLLKFKGPLTSISGCGVDVFTFIPEAQLFAIYADSKLPNACTKSAKSFLFCSIPL